MSRPIRATIDLSAIRHNLALARRLAGQARVWAVVKANAYGHGLTGVEAALEAADGLALLEFDRAIALRERQPGRPILMLEGAFDPPSTRCALDHGFDLVVHDEAQIEWIEALDGPRRLSVWVKMNSGMNRLGFARSHVRAAYERLTGAGAVARIGLMTHFANADQEDGWQEPAARFDAATRQLPGARCMANSTALLRAPQTHRQWVRPGIMLYGASPIVEVPAVSLGLRAAMRLESRLIGVQSLLPGDAVGYGATFVARRPMRIGVVACGYADGYPRAAGTGTPVWVAGRRARLVGRVSMDMLTVDLGEAEDCGVGAPVELWGEHVPIDEVAAAAGTIGYELMCALAPRVPMQWVDAP
ncbi:MAG: alanine racemase [Burkholderiaceae bacterium]